MDLILQVGPDMRSTYASPSSLHILGWTPEEMIGKPAEELVLPEDMALIEASVKQLNLGAGGTGNDGRSDAQKRRHSTMDGEQCPRHSFS